MRLLIRPSVGVVLCSTLLIVSEAFCHGRFWRFSKLAVFLLDFALFCLISIDIILYDVMTPSKLAQIYINCSHHSNELRPVWFSE